MNPAEIALIALIEFLFGLGYNVLVAWAHRNRLMHVSISVVVGVGATLLIPALAWFDLSMPFYQAGLLLALCFAASGTPMIVGSMQRSTRNHRRRALGNAAMRIRDDVIFELSKLAHQIADMSRENTLTTNDLPDIVNRIHKMIGSLKTL